jgi:hypothetical protein
MLKIDHYREGEFFEQITIPCRIVTLKDGSLRITIPPGCIVLATEDELRLNIKDAIEWLNCVGESQ